MPKANIHTNIRKCKVTTVHSKIATYYRVTFPKDIAESHYNQKGTFLYNPFEKKLVFTVQEYFLDKDLEQLVREKDAKIKELEDKIHKLSNPEPEPLNFACPECGSRLYWDREEMYCDNEKCDFDKTPSNWFGLIVDFYELQEYKEEIVNGKK